MFWHSITEFVSGVEDIVNRSSIFAIFEWTQLRINMILFAATSMSDANAHEQTIICRQFFCTHNVPIYAVSFVPPFSLAVDYYRIGCFKDTRNRAMPKLLGNWRHDSQAVQKCALAAEKAGYSVFGVQYAGECWSGPQAHLTYKKYGSSTTCVNGSGGAWAQDVYQIVSKCCIGDVSLVGIGVLRFLKCASVSQL